MAIFADDFTGSSGDDLSGRTSTPSGSTSGVWTLIGTGIANGAEINASNQLKSVDTNTNGSAFAAPDTGSADHWCEANIRSLSHSGFPLVCRMQDRNNFAVGFRIAVSAQLWQRSGPTGSLSQLGVSVAIPSPNANDVWRLEVTGTTADVYRNGVLFMSRTVSILSTLTTCGMVARSAVYDPWIEDWQSLIPNSGSTLGEMAGDLAASSAFSSSIMGIGYSSGSSASSSGLSSSISGIGQSSASSASSSTISGAAIGVGALPGQPVVASSSLSASIRGVGLASSSAAAISTLSGTLTNGNVITAISAAISTLSGSLSGLAVGSGSIVATSALTGQISGRGELVSTVAANSSLSAVLRGIAVLAGSINSSATISASIRATGLISGISQILSALSGTISFNGEAPVFPTPPERMLSVSGDSRVTRVPSRGERMVRVPSDSRIV